MALLTPNVVGPTLALICTLAPLCTALVIGLGWYGQFLAPTGLYLPFGFAYPLIYDPAVHGESAPPGGARHVCATVVAIVSGAVALSLAHFFYDPKDEEHAMQEAVALSLS